MASDAVTDCPEDTQSTRTDGGAPPVKQGLEAVEGRLVTLSEKISLCNRILRDLKDLSDVVVRKSLQDVSSPQLK